MKLLLASKSPRRWELLSTLGFPIEKVSIDVSETLAEPLPADRVAEALAVLKSSAFSNDAIPDGAVLVTADTVVVCDGAVLGKPRDRADAHRMLSMLRGRAHTVYTGVCLRSRSQKVAFTEATEVHFRNLTDDELYYYIDTYRPSDKAGAYGIQEWIGMVGVEKIVGCYYNVMGLPVARLYEMLSSRFASSLTAPRSII